MITGIVLAGGEAKRMGGVDKALVLHEGRPLIAWVVATLAPVCDEIVVARGSRPPLDGFRCVADDGGGPAAGLRAACAVARGEFVAVAPCDSPRLTSALYRGLLDAARGRDGACAEAEGVANALVGVYAREALARAMAGALDEPIGSSGHGRTSRRPSHARSPREAVARMDVARVSVPAALLEDVDERQPSNARGGVRGA